MKSEKRFAAMLRGDCEGILLIKRKHATNLKNTQEMD